MKWLKDRHIYGIRKLFISRVINDQQGLNVLKLDSDKFNAMYTHTYDHLYLVLFNLIYYSIFNLKNQRYSKVLDIQRF